MSDVLAAVGETSPAVSVKHDSPSLRATAGFLDKRHPLLGWFHHAPSANLSTSRYFSSFFVSPAQRAREREMRHHPLIGLGIRRSRKSVVKDMLRSSGSPAVPQADLSLDSPLVADTGHNTPTMRHATTMLSFVPDYSTGMPPNGLVRVNSNNTSSTGFGPASLPTSPDFSPAPVPGSVATLPAITSSSTFPGGQHSSALYAGDLTNNSSIGTGSPRSGLQPAAADSGGDFMIGDFDPEPEPIVEAVFVTFGRGRSGATGDVTAHFPAPAWSADRAISPDSDFEDTAASFSTSFRRRRSPSFVDVSPSPSPPFASQASVFDQLSPVPLSAALRSPEHSVIQPTLKTSERPIAPMARAASMFVMTGSLVDAVTKPGGLTPSNGSSGQISNKLKPLPPLPNAASSSRSAAVAVSTTFTLGVQTQIGENFEDKYSIEGKKVGSGSFAEVSFGTALATGMKVAVKVIKKKRLFTPEERESVRREVSVHLPMNHPNIIRLLDVYELEDCVMMVIERAEGRDLQSFINIRASPKFSEAVTRVLFQQLFDAMDYIHNTQRVIHCDMKPENILFGRDLLGDTVQSLGLFNRAKICDFGNARPARDAKYYNQTRSVSLVPFSEVTGTIGYIAPEILLRQMYDTAVDMWSLGVLMFQMLGGYRPFFVASACTTKKVTFPPQSWEKISPEAVDLCRGLLEQDPALRITARQAREHPWITNSLVPMPPSMIRNPSHLTLHNVSTPSSLKA